MTDDPSTAADDFSEELQRFLAGALSSPRLAVDRVDRSPGGHSWETYIVTVRSGDLPQQRFVAKRQPAVGMLGTYDLQREADLLHLARRAGVPVPDVIGIERHSPTGRGFYVTSFVDGVVPLPATLQQTVPSAEHRHSLGLELARVMARLHTHPIADVPDHVSAEIPSGDKTGVAAVHRWRESYRGGAPIRVPVLDLAFAWLEHHAGDVTGRTALIHNDLHVGNFIADGGTIAAVLDWETAEISDPAGDIAKFNLPTWQGGTGLASGLLPLDELLDEYGRHGGTVPGAATLRFWTVLSLTKSATIMVTSARQFSAGRNGDIRWGTMGFRMLTHLRHVLDLLTEEVAT